MILVLSEAFIIVVLLLCLCILWKYVLLMISKHNADKAFCSLLSGLVDEYGAIHNFLEQNAAVYKSELVNETERLISQAQDFTIEKDGNERIIGYANAVFGNMSKLRLQSNNQDGSFGYAESKRFQNAKTLYNYSAKRLRHYVDVFPTSLISRLKNIKTMDYIN